LPVKSQPTRLNITSTTASRECGSQAGRFVDTPTGRENSLDTKRLKVERFAPLSVCDRAPLLRCEIIQLAALRSRKRQAGGSQFP